MRPDDDSPIPPKPVEGAAVPVRPTKRRAKWMLALCWAYAGALVLFWLAVRIGADDWWPATALMFTPRYLWAAPLPLLALGAAVLRLRRGALPLACAGVLLLGPVMNLCVQWRKLAGPAGGGASPLKVLTLNVDHKVLDAAALRALLDAQRPDVVALQAWTSRHQQTLFGDGAGWHLRRDEELLLASRYPISDVQVATDPVFSWNDGALARYTLDTPSGPVRAFNLHLSTPRDGLVGVVFDGSGGARRLERNSERRRQQSQAARRYVDEALRGGARVIVMGDFNTPVDSRTYRTYWSDLTNAYSTAGFGFGNTHSVRGLAIRIDHVLCGPQWQVRGAVVGPYVGSGHRPVLADLEPVNAAN